jgi:hypothetical protein
MANLLHSAIRILSDRFVRNSSNVTSLCRDVYSRNPETRARGQQLLQMLRQHASDASALDFMLQNPHDIRDRTIRSYATPIGGRVGQTREHEESFEEQELRRRRREAVVFHDGEGPISREDIIQRPRATTDLTETVPDA